MNNHLNREEKIIPLLFALGLFGMLSILLAISFDKEKPKQINDEETYENITAFWKLDENGTKTADVKKLGEYMDPKSGVLSLYYQLPQMDKDESLIYRSKDVYTSILIDGEVLYETSVYESRFYNRSPGNLWNVVPISSSHASKVIKMQIKMVYNTDAVTVDSILFGDKGDIILGIFKDNIFGITVSLLLILAGIVLVIIDLLPAYGNARKRFGLFWLGVFAFLTGLWCLIETNVLQFCVEDMRILQLLDNMLMITDGIPLLLYLNAEYHIFKGKIMKLIGYIGSGYVLLCVAVQFSGITDLHYMIVFPNIFTRVTDIIIFIWMVWMLVKRIKEKKPLVNYVLQVIGISSLWIFSIIETTRSLNVDRIDRAGLIRVGMLILCLCLAVSSQIETYKVVERGLKYDLISKLAYSDGLTGLGNRTAYLEQLEEYEHYEMDSMQLGVVYLDVNNLKAVNDNQGHEQGDELIKIAAHIIEDSFGHYGKSYRIGGDEFCVLMTGLNLRKKYEEGLGIFQQLIQEANIDNSFNCKIQIAHGFAICEEFIREKIDRVIADADSKMYQNKMKLKGKG